VCLCTDGAIKNDNRHLSSSSTNVGKPRSDIIFVPITYRTSSYINSNTNTDEMPYNIIRSRDRLSMENIFTVMNNSCKVWQVKLLKCEQSLSYMFDSCKLSDVFTIVKTIEKFNIEYGIL